jgi:Pentapeptide repeats (8 copies)
VEDTDDPAPVRLERKAGEPAPAGTAGCDRPVRLVGWFAAVVLALAIALVLLVPAAHWLAHRDIGSARAPLLRAAEIAVQHQLLILGAGLFAAGALLGAAQNSAPSRRMLKLTRQRKVTSRYTRAIEQLGSDELDVRIGGIYALEGVAGASAGDHPAVMEALMAFIREHPHKPLRPPDPGRLEQEQWVRPDVQAALTVIARRKQERDTRPIDLTGANLNCADLHGATLHGADLTGTHALFANLTKTRLHRANLHGADLRIANLRQADLTRADLTGADLAWAYLTEAVLVRADLTGADLTGADLTGADLTGADLTDARWPQHAAVPEAWKLGTGT